MTKKAWKKKKKRKTRKKKRRQIREHRGVVCLCVGYSEERVLS